MNNLELNGNQDSAGSNTEWIEKMADVKPFDAAEQEKNQEKALDPRVESLEIPDSREAAIERVNRLRLSDEELIERTAGWNRVKVNQEALQRATERNGNPNVHGEGMYFEVGNLPMDDNSVYRHVGSSAIADLINQGFVRNKREAANALSIPGKRGFGTVGATVYWNDGDSKGYETADLVIQANKTAAEQGYVTKDDIQGIWVTDKNTGQPVNLIDGQDHTGLEIAPHRQ